MAFLLPMFVFSACSSDDNNNSNGLNSYEQKFVGTWIEDVSDVNGSEVFHVTFSSNRTGVYYTTNNGVKEEEQSFTWRADASTLYVTYENDSESGPYTFSNSKLNLGEIVYKKV